MKPSLPVLLSVNGGYVDTAGFLALHGLFTTHVTGNYAKQDVWCFLIPPIVGGCTLWLRESAQRN